MFIDTILFTLFLNYANSYRMYPFFWELNFQKRKIVVFYFDKEILEYGSSIKIDKVFFLSFMFGDVYIFSKIPQELTIENQKLIRLKKTHRVWHRPY
jgi:hypothetical protein